MHIAESVDRTGIAGCPHGLIRLDADQSHGFAVSYLMLVFIHLNKTGGSTVNHILRSSYGMGHCSVQPWHSEWNGPPFSNADLQRLRKLYPNLKSISGHRVVGYEDLKSKDQDLRYFTIMRDPVKASASSFQHKKQISGKSASFEEWIQEDWTHNRQTKMIAGVEDVNEAVRIIEKKKIFVGLTEHFDESMILLKYLVARDLSISYRWVNVAPSSSIAQNLLTSKRNLKILEEANQLDLELWNYIRTEIFPAYRKEYGPALGAALERFKQAKPGRFNERKVAASRLKVHLLYRPLLFLSRKGLRIV